MNKVTYSSVVNGSQSLIVSEIFAAQQKPIIYIALDDTKMHEIARNLAFFAPKIEVLTFPAWDCIPYDRVSPNSNITATRINSLSKLAANNKPRIIITTVNAALQKTIARDIIKNASFIAKIGNKIDQDALSDYLTKNGYINNSTASESGEFALRGGIIDIVPSGCEHGFRLDLFGDELESIKLYDPLTQISIPSKNRDSIELVPASEIIEDDLSTENFRTEYRKLFGAVTGDDPLYEAICEGRKYAGIEHWLPLFYDRMETIFDYAPDSIICFDHLSQEAMTEREDLINDSYKTRLEAKKIQTISEISYNPIPPEMLYLTKSELDKYCAAQQVISFNQFTLPESDGIVDKGFKTAINYYADSAKVGDKSKKSAFELLKQDFIVAAQHKKKTFIACASKGSQERMKLFLSEYEIPFMELDDIANSKGLLRKNGKIGLIILNIDHGFTNKDISIISEQDIFGEKILRPSFTKKKRSEKFIAEASNLSEGELVVHKEHGIGRFIGLETLTIQSESHDFILLIYDGGDKFYVPVENVDLVTRYGGVNEDAVLDKLGGVSWQKRTANLKKRIKMAAEELLDIAAKRATRKAAKFIPEAGSYGEFCARFPFNETEDQQNSIDAVIEDLASAKPMDRLICGDVGFGKTEVALRAAFIVAHEGTNNAQVAIITPTTLLCNQHYHGFKRRFKGFGLEVRQLSRLVSPKDARDTKQMLEEGKIDIIIGTHALLSDKIKFKNLSLLIVDEEQRFGVAQKEKLKKLRANTHVLTLTATPIPRTLQMSLTGVRDLSLITTPPVDRLAIRTYVMPFDPIIVREAILREHFRGGRSFYVCPRVKDVEEMEVTLKKLIPEVKIVTAHGRMPPEKLDNIMKDFYDGVFDVLLATTIIESGLDIPFANTLIIHRADMYGLAQLYQIRGRVGRSKVRAYAYLTLPPKRIPTKQAMKRLEVMQKLDSLGAGFSLASHDMDIRGFGNLLGDEQSGNIKEVGIELYQDMLRDAIAKIQTNKGEKELIENDFSTKINLGIAVLIPENYVADLGLRMSLYRRIANLEEEADIEAIAVELIDRFGKLPSEVENLLHVVKLKQLCKKCGIDKLDAGVKGAVISFYQNKLSDPEALINYVMQNPSKLKLRGDQKLIITNQNWHDINSRIKGLGEILGQI